jgi:hypothetical protein
MLLVQGINKTIASKHAFLNPISKSYVHKFAERNQNFKIVLTAYYINILKK